MSSKKNESGPDWLEEIVKEFGIQVESIESELRKDLDRTHSMPSDSQLLPDVFSNSSGQQEGNSQKEQFNSASDDPQKTVVVNKDLKSARTHKKDDTGPSNGELDLANELRVLKDNLGLSMPAKAVNWMDQAQKRILELEAEILRLKEENESIRLAYQATKSRQEELEKQLSEYDSLKNEALRSAQQEINALKLSLTENQKKRKNLENELEKMKNLIPQELKRIRQKELELESRLELLRLEKQALIRSKDEQILDLKKRLDDLNFDLNAIREKYQNMTIQVEQYKELIKHTAKTLRLLLVQMGYDVEDNLENDNLKSTG